MFNEQKVAQMAAYLLHKRGGRMSHLKLMKLMYLADRVSYDRYGDSITGDCAVSMPHGPVLSQTLNLVDGNVESASWSSWITDKENHEVSLIRTVEPSMLGELSEADLEILDEVFSTFGHMRRFEIRDFTHTLPEWKNPNGSSIAIETQDIFKALGKGAQQITGLMDRLHENVAVDRLFASIR